MAGGIRALKLEISVIDRATKIVARVKNDLGIIEKKKAVQTKLVVQDKASKPLQDVQRQTQTVTTKLQGMKNKLRGTTAGVRQFATANTKLNTVLAKTTAKLTANQKALEKQRAKLSIVSALITGMAGMFAHSAMAEEAARDQLNRYFDEMDVAKLNEFIDAAADLEFAYTDKGERAELAAMISMMGLTVDETMSLTEGVEKFFFKSQGALKNYGITSSKAVIQMIGRGAATGSWTGVNRAFRAQVVTTSLLDVEVARLLKTGGKYKDMTDEEVKTVAGLNLVQNHLAKTMKNVSMEATTSKERMENLRHEWSDLAGDIGAEVVPVFLVVARAMMTIIKFINSIPGGAKFVAIAMGITLIGVSLLILISYLPAAIAGFAALTAVTAPLWLIPAILIAVGAALAYLIYKSGLLSMMWEGLLEVWDLLKGVDFGDIAKSGMNLLFKMMFPPSVLAVFLKDVPAIRKTVQYLTNILRGVVDKLADITSGFVSKLDRFTPIVDIVSGICGAVTGWWDRLKEIVADAMIMLSEALHGIIGTPEEIYAKMDVKKADKAIISAAEENLTGVRLLVKETGIRRKSDDGFKAAVYQFADNIEKDEQNRLREKIGVGADENILYPDFQKLGASDRAKFAWSGLDTELSEKDMLARGFDLDYFEELTSRFYKKAHQASAETVADVAEDVKTKEPDWSVTGGLAEVGVAVEQINKDIVAPVVEKTIEIVADNTATEFVEGGGVGVAASTGIEVMKFVSNPVGYVAGKATEAVWGGSEEEMQSGGLVTRGGRAKLHDLEEVSPAEVVHKTTEAQKLVETILQPGTGKQVTINAPIEIHNHVQPIDINELMRRLQYDLIALIEDRMARAEGNYRT